MREVEFPRCGEDELLEVVLLRIVTLQEQTADLRNEELEVSAHLGPQVAVDSAHAQLLHRALVARIKFNQARNGVDVFVACH